MKLWVALALVGLAAAYPKTGESSEEGGSPDNMDSLRIKGRLVCGEWLVPQAEVHMWDADKVGKDDDMGKTLTNRDGQFELEGKAKDTGGGIIDPYIYIRHRCHYGKQYNAAALEDNPGFKRKVVFDPENIFQYVRQRNQGEGKQVGKELDLGTINLELKVDDDFEEAWKA